MKVQSQCSCNGGNPNCYRCGGWGYIDEVAANRVTDGPAGSSGKSILAARSKKLKVRIKPASVRLVNKIYSSDRAGEGAEAMAPKKTSKKSIVKKEIKKPVYSKSGVVKCACGAMVAEGLYYQHSCSINKRRRNRVKPASGGDGNSRFGEVKEVRSLDATDGYYGSFRDNGAFGSLPSFDDYGDESSS